ncbi:MAG: efflux RND transporter periplasmic adaptor subunit [Gemmatimonadetes bacterium]|nr:efflux RND transporter periplasmic adaptor subunit [Gemmatimonadota bacterium]
MHITVLGRCCSSGRHILSELLELGAVSEHETEENRARLAKLEARHEAARRDLESARALRQHTGSSAETIEITAPFSGRISEVLVTPGQMVASGTALARLVKAEPVWVKVALRPEAAVRVTEPTGLYLRTSGSEEPLSFSASEVRLISLSPGVDSTTGTVGVLLEVQSSVDDLRLWSAVEVEILLAGSRQGIVIPLSAIVDDSGISVVYVQSSGESFLRKQVQVVARQGFSALVKGLAPGERLVTRGGNSIRRATLVAAGPGEGHVH